MAETDPVVEWAQEVATWGAEPGAEPLRVNAVRFARWIVQNAPIVAAAKAHEAAKWSTPHRKVCRICKAVRSERTP